jgi:UDP-GlcNAc:undecaprenyl-phosphate GlcNAc-1-phosphate transferase
MWFDKMNILIIVGAVAFIISLVLMPISGWLSVRFGAVSDVGARHVGIGGIGRLGGLAVISGFGLSIYFSCLLDDVFGNYLKVESGKLLGLFYGVAMIGGVGFYDDFKRLAATRKLILQLLGASVAYFHGFKIGASNIPGLGSIEFNLLSYPITILWIVGIVNAVNLIDGLDGLAGGVVLFAAIVNLFASVGSGVLLSAALMAGVIGSVLAFLIFNWYPARLYLGDGGAYSLGFVLAAASLLGPFQKPSVGIGLLVPVLGVGVPLFDTAFSMVRRLLRRQGLFSADRGHLHHILLDSGISHRRAVIGIYCMCCFMCSVALMIVFSRHPKIGFVLVISSVFGFCLWALPLKRELLRAVRRVKDLNK